MHRVGKKHGFSLRVVTQMPLRTLEQSGSLDARRAESVGETEIVQLLRDGSSFVVVGRGVRVTISTVEQSADYL